MEKFELLRTLIGAKHVLSLFPDAHPMVQEKVEKLLEVIEALIAQEKKAEISIVGEEVFINEHSFRQESLEFARFVREITDTGITRISFQPGTTAKELVSLIVYLNEHRHTGPASKLLSEELRQRGINHITVSRILPLELSEKEAKLMARKSESEYQRAVSRIENIFKTVLEGGSFSPGSINLIVQGLLKTAIKDQSTLRGLFNIKSYHDYTFRHSVNVALLSILIGKRLKLNQELLALLGEAALLHDIGKIMIPKEIITKPSRLNATEWEIICRHPILGAEILSSVPGVNPMIARVALEHHVGYDGSGYPPLELNGKDNYLTQVVSICDFYDALTTVRSYRKPIFPYQAILLMLQRSKTQFNPTLVKVFISVVGFFPVGALVKTNRGEVGVVTKINPEDPLHPVIKILEDEQGKKISPQLVNTSEKNHTGNFVREILQVLDLQTHPQAQYLPHEEID